MPRNRRLMNQINVVPYIDVMLVLLVIFMVTAPMIQTGSVDLPSVGKASEVPAEPLQIEVAADGALKLRDKADEQSLDLPAIIAQIQAAQPRPVLISGDGKASYDDVMKVMNALQSAEIDKIGLLVQRGDTGPARQK
ncbi:MAG: ExbD/TolR family protein [Rhodocyclaceae bacterium]|nr:ExbD/TolR family protein [Rhodocyclaceae bacterium]